MDMVALGEQERPEGCCAERKERARCGMDSVVFPVPFFVSYKRVLTRWWWDEMYISNCYFLVHTHLKMIIYDSAHPSGCEQQVQPDAHPILALDLYRQRYSTLHRPRRSRRRRPFSFSYGHPQSCCDEGYSYTHADESLPILQSEKPLYFVTRKGTHQEIERGTE